MNHLTINDDGTVTAHLPGGDAIMRWPLCGEWDEIVSAHTKIIAEANEPDSIVTRPNAVILATVLGLLTDMIEPDPAKLPLWCDNATVLIELSQHWRTASIGSGAVPYELNFTPIDTDG